MTKTVTIYHTNDIHSHFENWPIIVQNIHQAREEAEQAGSSFLYFDCGDFLDRAHPLTEGTLGTGNTELLNGAAVDAVTIGNNEGITLTKEELNQLYDKASFPILVSNLFQEDGTRPAWAQPTKIFHTNGLKIGVTGVTVSYPDFYGSLNWKVTDPFSELSTILPNLRATCDLVIVLSHLGLRDDEKMAAMFDGIDVILGAHTHHVLPQGKTVGTTLIAQTGKYGQYVGAVTLDINETTLQKKATLIALDNLERDPSTVALLAQQEQRGQEQLQEVITVLEEPLTVSWTAPCHFSQLMADALSEWCEEPIAMINAGVLLQGLPAGPVTKGDLHRICPHPINPCIVSLSGRELQETISIGLSEEMMTKEVKGFGFRGVMMGRLVFTGIEVDEALLQTEPDRSITVRGKALQPEATYQVALLDMFTFGKLFPAVAQSHMKQFLLPETLRDLLAWKLQKR
ncbi:metallophosphoesterase [Fictibacillus macauensis ZFHKF-1]|uniref:Metallophosphoesterase n=1 Tax=Fictibacillus macauensis ZFHKF-1 TaxID=1196324 RepID=I8AMG5_9BACL|nr:bifunctional UDP-sugar hydrolase/5'-nucleotidase [Fictibacillus macauensis]EIT87167.1 metallophosphoesterase [Fictibacillus macauensis ZFHKF-1]